MKNEWVDEWSAEEVAQLSKYDHRLIECARLGKWCGPDDGDEKPQLSARLIVAIATGQHNQDWVLHPQGLFINGFTLSDKLNFKQRTVSIALYFDTCLLLKGAVFMDANLLILSFKNCSLIGENGVALSAERSSISGSLFLDHNFKSKGEILLRDSRISGNIEIRNACLDGNNGYAINAQGLTLQGSAILRSISECKGQINLINATIKGSLEIIDTDFNEDFIAQNLIIDGILVLYNIKFNPSANVSLLYAQADVLADDLASWQGAKEIFLDGFKYDHLQRQERGPALLKWLDKMPSKPFTPQPYEQLAKCLKSDGHLGDARMILIEKQNRLRKFGEIGALHKAWLWFTGPLMDFGYRPWKVVLPILIMLVLGYVSFSTDNFQHLIVPAKERIVMEQQKPENIGQPVHEWLPDYPSFNPIIYSIDTFFPFVDLKQEDYWIPRSKGYLWFHIAMGWFFSFLLVAGLAGLVKKDD